MKKIKKISKKMLGLAAVVSSLALSACGHSNNEPTPTPQPSNDDRTVLVYMVATNNLGSMGLDNRDIKEMQKAADEGKIRNGRLLVYHAAYNGDITLKEIKAGQVDTLRVYPSETVSVSSKQMLQVIDDMKSEAPAKDYGLVLWSHASGWLQDGIADEMDGPQRSYGSDNSKRMNISVLANTLKGQGFSFIYFDCCFMGSVETLYQLRDVTKQIVASPTEIHLEGMPYHLNLECFFASEPDLVQAAKNSYEYYAATYTEQDCPLSFAVLDPKHVDELAQATKQIYEHADYFMPAGYTPQKLSNDRICYYYDLQDYVYALCDDEALLSKWQDAMDKVVVYKVNASSIWGAFPLEKFGGLSTYIPESESDFARKNYDSLEWYSDVATYLFDK